MIPYDVDPSLHSTQPNEPVLDDGFSPPGKDEASTAQKPPGEPVLPDKSDF
ncbi:hypothetical protein [Ramlibacter sp. PS4R-6]|uniref:hypothetical protein n=1 Tax=Ramlibacter sp. PS4R-6 TaxID=3133438 RepID=UPI0030A7EBA8